MAPPFAVVVSTDEVNRGPVLITAAGEVDMATAPQLQEAIVAQVDGKRVDVVVDLAAVTFLDSSGIAALIRARRRVGELGGTLTLRNPEPRVRKTLHLTGVDQVFVIEAG